MKHLRIRSPKVFKSTVKDEPHCCDMISNANIIAVLEYCYKNKIKAYAVVDRKTKRCRALAVCCNAFVWSQAYGGTIPGEYPPIPKPDIASCIGLLMAMQACCFVYRPDEEEDRSVNTYHFDT